MTHCLKLSDLSVIIGAEDTNLAADANLILEVDT